MEETKADKALKESDIANVEYKMYLCLGANPDHDGKVIDITESIPDEIIEEYYGNESDSRGGIASSVIGVKETIKAPEINSGVEIPLTNSIGLFVSVQQKINVALQAAIVNGRQLNALIGIIDGIFRQCQYERELGLKHCVEENS